MSCDMSDKEKIRTAFEEWTKELHRYAKQMGMTWIPKEDPEIYRDYFDDGYDPVETVNEEAQASK